MQTTIIRTALGYNISAAAVTSPQAMQLFGYHMSDISHAVVAVTAIISCIVVIWTSRRKK